jgi:hypothetical protein
VGDLLDGKIPSQIKLVEKYQIQELITSHLDQPIDLIYYSHSCRVFKRVYGSTSSSQDENTLLEIFQLISGKTIVSSELNVIKRCLSQIELIYLPTAQAIAAHFHSADYGSYEDISDLITARLHNNIFFRIATTHEAQLEEVVDSIQLSAIKALSKWRERLTAYKYSTHYLEDFSTEEDMAWDDRVIANNDDIGYQMTLSQIADASLQDSLISTPFLKIVSAIRKLQLREQASLLVRFGLIGLYVSLEDVYRQWGFKGDIKAIYPNAALNLIRILNNEVDTLEISELTEYIQESNRALPGYLSIDGQGLRSDTIRYKLVYLFKNNQDLFQITEFTDTHRLVIDQLLSITFNGLSSTKQVREMLGISTVRLSGLFSEIYTIILRSFPEIFEDTVLASTDIYMIEDLYTVLETDLDVIDRYPFTPRMKELLIILSNIPKGDLGSALYILSARMNIVPVSIKQLLYRINSVLKESNEKSTFFMGGRRVLPNSLRPNILSYSWMSDEDLKKYLTNKELALFYKLNEFDEATNSFRYTTKEVAELIGVTKESLNVTINNMVDSLSGTKRRYIRLDGTVIESGSIQIELIKLSEQADLNQTLAELTSKARNLFKLLTTPSYEGRYNSPEGLFQDLGYVDAQGLRATMTYMLKLITQGKVKRSIDNLRSLISIDGYFTLNESKAARNLILSYERGDVIVGETHTPISLSKLENVSQLTADEFRAFKNKLFREA